MNFKKLNSGVFVDIEWSGSAEQQCSQTVPGKVSALLDLKIAQHDSLDTQRRHILQQSFGHQALSYSGEVHPIQFRRGLSQDDHFQ